MQVIENDPRRIVYEIKNYKACSPKRKRLSEWSHIRTEFWIIGVLGVAMFPAAILEKVIGDFGVKGSTMGIVVLFLVILFWDLMWWPDPSRVRHRYTITVDKAERKLSWRRFGWRLGDPLYQNESLPFSTINTSNVLEQDGCWRIIFFAQGGKTIYLDMPDSNSAYEIKAQLDRTIRKLSYYASADNED